MRAASRDVRFLQRGVLPAPYRVSDIFWGRDRKTPGINDKSDLNYGTHSFHIHPGYLTQNQTEESQRGLNGCC